MTFQHDFYPDKNTTLDITFSVYFM